MADTTSSAYLLEVRNIVKSFPGVKALQDVSFGIYPGEVIAVLGENGAGKSTMMKILAGVQEPDSGTILLDGKEVAPDSVDAAQKLGIALIHQELNLSDNLDVAANLFLGHEPRSFGVINFKKLYKDAQELLDRCGFRLDPRALVSDLSIGRQQLIEIAKALSLNARIIIMDEPTSSLSAHETDQLFGVIRDLKARGIAVGYISHRLVEVKEVADRCVGLRDGRFVGELAKSEISHDSMVKLMIGRDLAQRFPHKALPPGEVVMEVKSLHTPQHPKYPISFSLRGGEIVGIAGLVGAGRSELVNTLFGYTPPVSGTVTIKGNEVSLKQPRTAIAAGIALVPEDRKQQGLILDMTVRENTSLAVLDRTAKAGVYSTSEEKRVTRSMIDRLRIKTPSDQQVVKFLSGGNQQKVVLGKWLASDPAVLMLDEPTRGIDVGAKREIYLLMDELAQRGVAVLFVSSELEEVLGMSDRILVMHEGEMAGELSKGQMSEEAVMQLATGGE